MLAQYSFPEKSDLFVIKQKYMYVKKAYIKNEFRKPLNTKMVFFPQTDKGSVICVYWDYNL